MRFVKWLREREIEPEVLDTLPVDAARASLADLVRLNRDFGGHSALGHALRAVVRNGEAFSLVDVGAASGDMGRAVRALYPQARVMSTDRIVSHLEGADF